MSFEFNSEKRLNKTSGKMPDEKQFSFNATGNILRSWIFVGYLMKVTAQLMIMISFPDCTVSPRPLRAVVGGSEDLGVDDGQ